MKKLRIVCTIFTLIFGFSFLGGCKKDKACAHEYSNYVTKQATCTETGTLEKVCNLCGDKVYEDLQVTGHTIENGVCTSCGKSATIIDMETGGITSPDDVAAFYTWTEIHQIVNDYGYSLSEDEFYNALNSCYFSNIYINGKGKLKAESNGISLSLAFFRPAYKISSENPNIIYGLQIDWGRVSVVYTTGLLTTVGYISSAANPIEGILINEDNQFLVLYKDGLVSCFGRIANIPTDLDDDTLLYGNSYKDGCYSVFGIIDKNTKSIVIPSTHLGKRVFDINDSAFANCKKLKSVTIPEGIETIGNDAFSNCSALQSVYLPNSVNYFGASVFEGCTSLTKIYYQGTQEEWLNVNISCNEKLDSVSVIFQS